MRLPHLRATALGVCGIRPRAVRSNRHLHHRLADTRTSAINGVRWGTGDLGVSDVNSGASLREEPEPWRAAALARRPPRCVSQGRDSNPLFPWCEVSDIFTTSVG